MRRCRTTSSDGEEVDARQGASFARRGIPCPTDPRGDLRFPSCTPWAPDDLRLARASTNRCSAMKASDRLPPVGRSTDGSQALSTSAP
jgi:hypothetical protein